MLALLIRRNDRTARFALWVRLHQSSRRDPCRPADLSASLAVEGRYPVVLQMWVLVVFSLLNLFAKMLCTCAFTSCSGASKDWITRSVSHSPRDTGAEMLRDLQLLILQKTVDVLEDFQLSGSVLWRYSLAHLLRSQFSVPSLSIVLTSNNQTTAQNTWSSTGSPDFMSSLILS